MLTKHLIFIFHSDAVLTCEVIFYQIALIMSDKLFFSNFDQIAVLFSKNKK